MRLGIRGKLFLLSLGLIALSLIIGYGALRPTLDRLVTQRTQEELQQRLRLVAHAAEQAKLSAQEPQAWRPVARELAPLASARVTLLLADGTPLSDSEMQGLHENHRARPEIAAALSTGMGSSTRYSATLHTRMMYEAMAFKQADGTPAIARLAMPLVEVDRAMSRLHVALSIAALLALGVAVVMSSLAAHLAARSLRQITDAAHRMARGDLRTRAQPVQQPNAQDRQARQDTREGHERNEGDELTGLGRDLDALAESLSAAMRALVHERDLLNSVLAGLREGVLLVDDGGHVALANPSLRELLQIDDGAVGEPLAAAGVPASLLSLVERAGPESSLPLVEELALDGPKPRRLLLRAERLRGDEPRTLLVAVDVTELRRLESVRRDFVANASHELRTPLTAVCSAIETLRAAKAPDAAVSARFLDMAARNAARLQKLVEDLLDLSRIETQEFRLTLAPVPLAELQKQVFSLLVPRARERNLVLSVDRESPPCQVLAERRALEQVLYNLLDNAIKYCSPGVDICLGWQMRDGHVRVTLRDGGPGIAEQHLPRLFERFYRVDAGRSRDLGGTGLGLAIVKHLVEAMGGEVGVSSTKGQGTTFWFTLRIAHETDRKQDAA